MKPYLIKGIKELVYLFLEKIQIKKLLFVDYNDSKLHAEGN